MFAPKGIIGMKLKPKKNKLTLQQIKDQYYGKAYTDEYMRELYNYGIKKWNKFVKEWSAIDWATADRERSLELMHKNRRKNVGRKRHVNQKSPIPKIIRKGHFGD